MNKQIKGLLLTGLLVSSGIAQAEQNSITALPKALAVGFGSGFAATVIPVLSFFVPAALGNAYDEQKHIFSKSEKIALTGSAIAGAAAAIAVWYKTGQCITSTLWDSNTGRYVAIVPAVWATMLGGLAYCLSKIEIPTVPRGFPFHASSTQEVTSSEPVIEG